MHLKYFSEESDITLVDGKSDVMGEIEKRVLGRAGAIEMDKKTPFEIRANFCCTRANVHSFALLLARVFDEEAVWDQQWL